MALPKKGKKTSSAAASGDPAKLHQLVMRCSRAELERMVRESIETGNPCTLEAVEAAAVPDPETATGTVSTLELRTAGTGHFEALSSFVHQQIFVQLCLKDRLTVALAVCKAWRSLKADAAMWRTLDGLRAARRGSTAEGWCGS